MESTGFALPTDPLARFVEIFEALEVGRGWWETPMLLRHSALALTAIPGDPRELASRVRQVAEDLRASQPWYRRTSMEVMLATQLLRTGRSIPSMNDEIERAKTLFRARWRFSGGVAEVLAILTLADASPDDRVTESQVARLAALYAGIRVDHPYLTQKSDWPLCALLTLVPGEPETIARRVEDLYTALRGEHFPIGDALQTASFVLALVPGAPSVHARRFRALYDAFAAAGLRMLEDDYDEIAVLGFSEAEPAVVVATVLRHRERIADLTPRPNRQTSFSLAAGTALLELVRDETRAAKASEADGIARILGVLAAQRAALAVVAATSASSAH